MVLIPRPETGMFLPYIRSRVQKFPAWPTFEGDRNKTNLLFFNIVFLHFNTLFNWYINLTINGTVYPSQHFPIGADFACQAGNFWTLLRTFPSGSTNIPRLITTFLTTCHCLIAFYIIACLITSIYYTFHIFVISHLTVYVNNEK